MRADLKKNGRAYPRHLPPLKRIVRRLEREAGSPVAQALRVAVAPRPPARGLLTHFLQLPSINRRTFWKRSAVRDGGGHPDPTKALRSGRFALPGAPCHCGAGGMQNRSAVSVILIFVGATAAYLLLWIFCPLWYLRCNFGTRK